MTNQNIDGAGIRGFPRRVVMVTLTDDGPEETGGLGPNTRGE